MTNTRHATYFVGACAFLLAAGCGHPAPRAGRVDDGFWHAAAGTDSKTPSGASIDVNLPELVPELPPEGPILVGAAERLEEELAEEAAPAPEPEVVLRASGRIEVDGRTWPRSQDQPVEETVGFRDVLRRLAQNPKPGTVYLAADRSTPWADLDPWLRLAKWPKPAHAVVLLVRRHHVERAAAFGFDLFDDPSTRSDPLRVTLRVEDGPAGAQVVLQVAERSWTFAPAPAFDSPAFLAKANRAWGEVVDVLPVFWTVGGVELEIDPRVPCAYPLMLLDVLRLTTGHTVHRASTGERLSMFEGDPLESPRRPDPSYGALWFWSILLAALTVVGTCWPLLDRRVRAPGGGSRGRGGRRGSSGPSARP